MPVMVSGISTVHEYRPSLSPSEGFLTEGGNGTDPKRRDPNDSDGACTGRVRGEDGLLRRASRGERTPETHRANTGPGGGT
jgi:hypothetical protein